MDSDRGGPLESHHVDEIGYDFIDCSDGWRLTDHWIVEMT